MRKLFLLVLVLCLIAANMPQVSSYYNATGYKQVLISKQWTDITASSFNQMQEGFYRLDKGVFKTDYVGLVKLSGRCLLKRAPEVFTFYVIVNGVSMSVLTTEAAESFVIYYTFPAGDVTLSIYTESQYGANGLNCNLLFEKVD